MGLDHVGILGFTLLAPLGGAGVLLLCPSKGARERRCQRIALLFSLVSLVLAAWIGLRFDRGFGVGRGNYGMQFIVQAPPAWPGLPLELHLGVDGLSMGFLLLATLLWPIALVCPRPPGGSPRGYYALLLFMETGLLGVLLCLDGLLLCGSFGMLLVPLGLLIGRHGSRPAAYRLLVTGALGLALLSLSIGALYQRSLPAHLLDGTQVSHSFDLVNLTYQNHFGDLTVLGLPFGKLVWIALSLALLVLLPVAPFHPWLPEIAVAAPPGVALLLFGVVSRLGIYGLLRLAYGILPDATHWAAPGLALFGVLALLYGGLRALNQEDPRRFLGFAAIAQGGICLLGAASFTQTGFGGALFQAIAQGLIAALLVFLSDSSSSPRRLALGERPLLLPACRGVAMMAALGQPGLCGFVGVGLVLLGAFPVFRLATAFALLLQVLLGAGHLRALRRMIGSVPSHDLGPGQAAVALPLLLLLVGLGVYPGPLLSLSASAMEDLLSHTTGHTGAGAIAGPPHGPAYPGAAATDRLRPATSAATSSPCSAACTMALPTTTASQPGMRATAAAIAPSLTPKPIESGRFTAGRNAAVRAATSCRFRCPAPVTPASAT